ncbi:hypothetical protein Bca4012_092530 [Brassica carinata]
MLESPQNSRTGSNSHCESNDTSFLIPQEPVRSPDPLLFTQEFVRSPTLTLPEGFKLPDTSPPPPQVSPEEQMILNPTEPTETPPRRQTNLEYFLVSVNEHLNVFGETPVTPA